MNYQNLAHRQRLDADIGYEWDKLPDAVEQLDGVSDDCQQLVLRRIGKAPRGLQRLGGLKMLRAHSVDQAFLDEIVALEGLEHLSLNRVTATDLSGLRRLPRLRRLDLSDATRIDALDWLPESPTLRSLAFENLPRVADLDALTSLASLTALGVEGSMWTPMRVASLSPLATMPNLRALFLTNTRVSDRSLAPLAGLANLQVLSCARFFPDSEFRALRAARPGLQCSWFDKLD